MYSQNAMFNEQYAKLVAKFGKRNVLIGAAVVAVIVLGWIANGVGGSLMSDDAAERAIEAATGGRVDVDADGGTYTVKTDDGTWSTSDKLPSDWPSDAPLYPGADVQGSVAAAGGDTQGVGQYVGLLSSDSAQQVAAWYKSELAAKGWTVGTDITTPQGSMIGADKGGRTVAVTITSQDGKTAIGVTIATK